jgi:dipeptidyl aminopeptidase/acylaminoacyl peptidase
MVASSSIDGTTRLWDFANGKESHRLSSIAPPGRLKRLTLSSDGQLLATTDDEFIHFYEAKTWKELRRVRYGNTSLNAIAFDPTGRALASAAQDGIIRVLDVETGEEVCRMDAHAGPLMSLAYLPDGDSLVASSWNGDIRLWGVVAVKQAYCFKGHRDNANCLAVSPDGSLLASGSRDSTILLWDLAGPATPGPKQADDLTEKVLTECWEALAGHEPLTARQAIRSLAGAPVASTAFLKRQFRPVPVVDQARLSRLITDLDSNRFSVRESAAKELEKIGEPAVAALRAAQSANSSAEHNDRVGKLLKVLCPLSSRSELQRYRAVEVLERIASAESMQLLRLLAAGAPEATLTKKAKGSLERLRQREAFDSR